MKFATSRECLPSHQFQIWRSNWDDLIVLNYAATILNCATPILLYDERGYGDSSSLMAIYGVKPHLESIVPQLCWYCFQQYWPPSLDKSGWSTELSPHCKFRVKMISITCVSIVLNWHHWKLLQHNWAQLEHNSIIFDRVEGWGNFSSLPIFLSLIHIWRCRRSTLCRSRWSPYH